MIENVSGHSPFQTQVFSRRIAIADRDQLGLGHAEWPQFSLSNRARKNLSQCCRRAFAAFSPGGMPVVQFQRFNQANGTARSGIFVARIGKFMHQVKLRPETATNAAELGQTHRSSVRRYKRASKTARSDKCLGGVTRWDLRMIVVSFTSCQ
jgi:hypothetical protein